MNTPCPDCQRAERSARRAYIAAHVHETELGWIIAQRVGTNYIASMSPRARRVTGCSQVSACTVDRLARDSCVQVYGSRAGAVRALGEDHDSTPLCPTHKSEMNAYLREQYA